MSSESSLSTAEWLRVNRVFRQLGLTSEASRRRFDQFRHQGKASGVHVESYFGGNTEPYGGTNEEDAELERHSQ